MILCFKDSQYENYRNIHSKHEKYRNTHRDFLKRKSSWKVFEKRKKLLEGATFFELLFIMTALRYARPLDYSAAIAPVGHGSSQAPQSMQVSGSTTYFVGPSEIASTGHTAAHAPQLTHSSLTTCAIMVPPF